MLKSENQGIIESNRLTFKKSTLIGELRRALREGCMADCNLEDVNKSLNFFVDENNNPICPYSGTKLTVENLHLEHIVPIILGGGTVAENLIPSCSTCNISKNGNHMIEWYEVQPFFSIERFQKIVDYIFITLTNKTFKNTNNLELDEIIDNDPIIQTSGDVWETQEEAYNKHLEKQKSQLRFDEFLLQCILKLNENGIYVNKSGEKYIDLYKELIDKRIIRLDDNDINIQQSIYNKIKKIVKNKFSTTININYKTIEQNLKKEQTDINSYLDKRFKYLKEELDINDIKLGLLIESVPNLVSLSSVEIHNLFLEVKKKINVEYLYNFIINNNNIFNNNLEKILTTIDINTKRLKANANIYLNGIITENTIEELEEYFINPTIDFFTNKNYRGYLSLVIKGNSCIRNQLLNSDGLSTIVEDLINTNNYDEFKLQLRKQFDDNVTDLEFEYKYSKIINHNDFKKYLFLERFRRNAIKKYNIAEYEYQKEELLKIKNIKDFNKKHNFKSQIQTIFATNSSLGTSGTENHQFIHLSKFNDVVEDLINGEKLSSDKIKNKLKKIFLENTYNEEIFEEKYNQYLNHQKIYLLIELEKIKREQIKNIYKEQLSETINKIKKVCAKKELRTNEFAYKNKLQLIFSRNTCIGDRRINPSNFNELIDDLYKGLEFGSLEFKEKLKEIFIHNNYSYDEFLGKYKQIITNYEIINNLELMKIKEQRINEINQEYINNHLNQINNINSIKEISKKDYWYLEKLRSLFISNSNISGVKLGSSNFTEIIELLINGKSFKDDLIKEYFYKIFAKISNGNKEIIEAKYNQYLNNDDIKIYLILEKRKRERIQEIYKEKFLYYKNIILNANTREDITAKELYFKSNLQTVISNNTRINNKKPINLSYFNNVCEKLIMGMNIKSEEIKKELLLIFLENGRTENEFEIKYKAISEHPEISIYVALEQLKRMKLKEFENKLGGKQK